MTDKEAMEFQLKLRRQINNIVYANEPSQEVIAHTLMALAEVMVAIAVSWVGRDKGTEFISKAINTCLNSIQRFEEDNPPLD